ncbi:tRNA (adenosine(37)-N6)-dimethylallyltransferase MiaA [Weissella koreensis]|uniref:tRNA dimethylallyltransferase n=1 Tax=Weissella koreensis TaxID=165096 RepID=A0A7H1MMF8_9LACO|nr:tRNA (adenosine(37)-N6)-dimethylallyltransferase MiaA [Weissella koreensis]AVH75441.1 tRNA (adenosine(37)-N6)-dimethylallyltransferase MiaA [Weissella koreensis]EJF34419.1 tRNA isopentenyltransferase [Weissella koreensis KCTC 3621]QGN20665.1 tRNA (adenosine(37)-N6)-dimethylallyltransferase MiaA [Weissella koreensis]QNT64644.1 tRNA (adenosine(37)-N6)-dimethylallyltransferase MiaA [Weissella koreensis]
MQKIIVIAGPTAVGKTDLSLQLAKKFDGEIISGDSMQIYRHLDIGTAKATKAEQDQVPHHLIDLLEPTENFSVAQFVRKAQENIHEIASRGKIPIIVGGTGFYLQALLGDRPLAPVDDVQIEPDFITAWEQQVAQFGENPLREALAKVDLVSAERILPGQIRRMIRALAISQTKGQPFSSLQPQPKRQYDAYIIGLDTDRQVLYDRINQRVDHMLTLGLMDEVAMVSELPDAATAKKAIGYKELFPVLDQSETLEQGVAELKQASRRYAKRQLTWFRNQFNDINWYDLVKNPAQLDEIETDIQNFMA